MNIVIEDLGIRLQPVGGKGSHALVRADMARRSMDLGRNTQWVRIEEFEVVSPNAPKVPHPVAVVVPAKPPVVPEVSQLPQSSQPQSSELEELKKSLDGMVARQEELFKLLQSAVQRPITYAHVPTAHVGNFSSDDEIILPGKLVPESVEVNVKVREDEHSADDFDNALAALKKAKNK
jgi:hypothetical protein